MKLLRNVEMIVLLTVKKMIFFIKKNQKLLKIKLALEKQLESRNNLGRELSQKNDEL